MDPFTYWDRKDGVPDTRRLTGSATTLVLDAQQQSELSYQVCYLPWARVQQELADYRQNGLCELTWDASYKPERAEYALYSVPLNLALPSRKGVYLLVSKGSPRAHELVNRLNQALVGFQEGGHVDEVMRRFLPPIE
jgi:hypothetical protein